MDSSTTRDELCFTSLKFGCFMNNSSTAKMLLGGWHFMRVKLYKHIISKWQRIWCNLCRALAVAILLLISQTSLRVILHFQLKSHSWSHTCHLKYCSCIYKRSRLGHHYACRRPCTWRCKAISRHNAAISWWMLCQKKDIKGRAK